MPSIEKTARTYKLRLIALENFAMANGDDAVLFGPNKRPFLAATSVSRSFLLFESVMVRVCYFFDVKVESHVQNLHPLMCRP